MKTVAILTFMSLFSCAPLTYSTFFALTPKKKNFASIFLFSAAAITVLCVKVYFDTFNYTSMISIIVSNVLLFLLMNLFTKDSSSAVLKLYLMFCSAMVISEFVCALIMYAMGIKLSTTNGKPPALPIRLWASFVVMIFMFIAAFIWKRLVYGENEYGFATWKFAIVLGCQLIFGSMFIINIYAYESKMNVVSVVAFMGISWVITDVFFVRAVFDNLQKAQLKMSLKQAMQLEKMQYEYYENLTESVNSLRKYRHDLNNTLQTLSLIINDPETKSDGKELFDQMCEKYKQTQIPYYSSNPVINAVILSKTLAAEEYGVKLDISVNCDGTDCFEGLDLCSVFSNLLDNALEAASNTENGIAELSSWTEAGYFFVKSVNTYNGEVRKNGKKIVSTKGSGRGLGLSIIENIAEKYGGKVVVDSGEMFSVLVALKVSQEPVAAAAT